MMHVLESYAKKIMMMLQEKAHKNETFTGHKFLIIHTEY